MRWAALLGFVALAMAGCGGGESDEDEVRGVVDTWNSAVARADGEATCSVMSQSGADVFFEPRPSEGCPAAVKRNVRVLGSFGRAAGLEVDKVTVTGDEATAAINQVGFTYVLERADGDWKIINVQIAP